MNVVVSIPTSSLRKYCRMKFQADGKAIINSNEWRWAVQTFDLHEGDVCVFKFIDDRVIPKRYRDPRGWLRMEIIKLEEEV